MIGRVGQRGAASSPSRTIRAVWPRYANGVLGIWLFASAFALSRNPAGRTDAWVVGICITLAAVLGTAWPGVRSLTTALAVWLALATLIFYPVRPVAFWHDNIVAAIVFVLSLTPR